MKKIILFTITILFGLTSSLLAQADEASTTASANVLAQLTIQKAIAAADLGFGNVSAGTVPQITASSGDAVQFNVTGANQLFYWKFPATITLDHETASVADKLQLNASVNAGQSSVQSDASVGVSTDGSDTIVGSDYYFWLGGTISATTSPTDPIPTSHETGTYQGTFTIEVGYSSF